MKIFTTINEVKQSLINEGTTSTYKSLIKRAKELGIETISELEDLIFDEFQDETPHISGADFEIAKKQLKLNESNHTVDWKLQNPSSSLKFIYPPKPDSLTKKFLDFIYQNPGSTKAEFYNHINRQLTPGNNAHFFAGIKDAGLVELVGNKYYIGQNYGKWTQGKLSTNPSKGPSFYDKIRKFNESKGTIHGFTLDDLKLLGFKSKEDFKEKLTKASKEDQKFNKLPLSVCKEDNIKVYHDELKSIKKKQNINESNNNTYQENLQNHINRIGDDITCEDLVEYIWNNYTEVTGLEDSYKYEESHWPEQIEDLVNHYEIDMEEFEEEWSYMDSDDNYSDPNDDTPRMFYDNFKSTKIYTTINEFKNSLKVNESNEFNNNYDLIKRYINSMLKDVRIFKKAPQYVGHVQDMLENTFPNQLQDLAYYTIEDLELRDKVLYLSQDLMKRLPGNVSRIDYYITTLNQFLKDLKINESLVKVINVTEEDLDIFRSHTGLNGVIEDGMIVYEEGLYMFALVKHSDGTFILMKYNDTLDEYEELPGLYDVQLNKIS